MSCSFSIYKKDKHLLTFTIDDSNIDNSKNGGQHMSSMDIAILGMIIESPQSAYDIQKDVEYHHYSRWTKISTPSVYRRVLKLNREGYIQSSIVKGEKAADKAVYSITDKGRERFERLMLQYAKAQIPLLFDFNMVISNLNKVEHETALKLIDTLKESIAASMGESKAYAEEYKDIPLVGRTVFTQQGLVYSALLSWLDGFEEQYIKGESHVH